jgi:predicted porin
LKGIFKVFVRCLIIIFTIFSLSNFAFAFGSNSEGLSLEGGLGLPNFIITNPDGSEAGYEGISLQGRVFTPLVTESNYSIRAQAVMRYFTLDNVKNNDAQSEVANHVGPGLGISFSFARLELGYEYMLMKANHYYVSNVGVKTEFDYTIGNMYLGANIPFGDLSAGIHYSYSTGKISKDETGLSKDSDVKEQTIWLTLRYDTGASVVKAASKLVQQ